MLSRDLRQQYYLTIILITFPVPKRIRLFLLSIAKMCQHLYLDQGHLLYMYHDDINLKRFRFVRVMCKLLQITRSRKEEEQIVLT